jgi:hypothetical protein
MQTPQCELTDTEDSSPGFGALLSVGISRLSISRSSLLPFGKKLGLTRLNDQTFLRTRRSGPAQGSPLFCSFLERHMESNGAWNDSGHDTASGAFARLFTECFSSFDRSSLYAIGLVLRYSDLEGIHLPIASICMNKQIYS